MHMPVTRPTTSHFELGLIARAEIGSDIFSIYYGDDFLLMLHTLNTPSIAPLTK